jgi:hypothetical protein
MAQMSEAVLQVPWISMTGSQKMGSRLARPEQKDSAIVKELLQAGKVVITMDPIW